jgi:flagellar hook-basal body complex protein FliE
MIAAIHGTAIGSAALSSTSASIVQLPGNHVASKAGDSPFSDLMTDTIGNVSQLEDRARTAVDGLMTGSGVDVHQAMIASEKASMAFEMALAVRNKAIQSYQSVMGMQF